MSNTGTNIVVPRAELELRWAKTRKFLAQTAPEAGGLLAFSKLQIFYLSGTIVNGVLWLPIEGEPVLFVRRSVERARIESSIKNICSFKSFKDLAPLAKNACQPLSKVIGAESAGLTWQLGEMLTSRMSDTKFVPCDEALAFARSLKSEWELAIMRKAGELHNMALVEIVPEVLQAGMTELEIAHFIWNVFFELGHQGHMRMQAFGEEVFLGVVSAGESGIYPNSFNGPLGMRGEHPASPFMGSSTKKWENGSLLSTDVGFVMEGYHTDKTQVYWSGSRDSVSCNIMNAQSFCKDMQDLAADNLKPGARPSDIYALVMSEAEKSGYLEGFMGLGESKVPFLGHGIGLTIDGYPPIAKGFDVPIEEGMVFALEPKMGIPGVGMVGVENTFEITKDGAKSITGENFDMIFID